MQKGLEVGRDVDVVVKKIPLLQRQERVVVYGHYTCKYGQMGVALHLLYAVARYGESEKLCTSEVGGIR